MLCCKSIFHDGFASEIVPLMLVLLTKRGRFATLIL
jgi:hypothetical protein